MTQNRPSAAPLLTKVGGDTKSNVQPNKGSGLDMLMTRAVECVEEGAKQVDGN